MLTVLGFLCADYIKAIYAFDISADSLNLARENLSLLTENGLMVRRRQLDELYKAYNKPSHASAIDSANRLLKRLKKPIISEVFQADALHSESFLNVRFKADIVIADVPYGSLTQWEDDNTSHIYIYLRTGLVRRRPAGFQSWASAGLSITNKDAKALRLYLAFS